jgi:uncharacterized OB-fold protein
MPKGMTPPTSELTTPFWDATKQKKLLLQWCTSCNQVVHYPREACPKCLGFDLEWREATGKGEVYAVSVQARSPEPYAVALVDLPEGARLMTNIVGVDDLYSIKVGAPVQVAWEELGDGRNLPLFELVG